MTCNIVDLKTDSHTRHLVTYVSNSMHCNTRESSEIQPVFKVKQDKNYLFVYKTPKSKVQR